MYRSLGEGFYKFLRENIKFVFYRELLIKVFLFGLFKIWLERLYVLCYSKEGNVREKFS